MRSTRSRSRFCSARLRLGCISYKALNNTEYLYIKHNIIRNLCISITKDNKHAACIPYFYCFICNSVLVSAVYMQTNPDARTASSSSIRLEAPLSPPARQRISNVSIGSGPTGPDKAYRRCDEKCDGSLHHSREEDANRESYDGPTPAPPPPPSAASLSRLSAARLPRLHAQQQRPSDIDATDRKPSGVYPRH